MTQQSAFFVLEGGLDQTTQAIAMPRGRAIACSNFECVQEGYGRVAGYERFDGRQSPSAAAAGIDSPFDAQTARNAARALIQPVPGSGPVRGVWWFKGKLYAWRDNVGATETYMYVSSPTGWQRFDTGRELSFTSGGIYEIQQGDTITGATSGATAQVVRVQKATGTWAAGDAAGSLVVRSVTGTFVGENLNVGANSNVGTIAAAPIAQGFAPSGRFAFITHNFYGATNLRRAYGVFGNGRAFEFDESGLVFIPTGMPDDAPIHIAAYKQHLFLAFRGGSVQYSDVGDPTIWNPTLGGVGEIGMGDEITDFISNNQDSLTILCASSIATLIGSVPADFVLQTITDEAGAVPYTAQRIGVAYYLDNRGVRSITATQAYGNFKLGTITSQIDKTLRQKRTLGAMPIASAVIRTKNHYRLFYDDGSGISIFFGRKNPEAMRFDLPDVVRCICTVDDPGASERVFFGTDSGFVHEMESGPSFDGASIAAYVQLAFNNEGAPWILKRWSRIEVELVAKPNTRIKMLGEYDYAGGEQPSLAEQTFDVSGGGALWGVGLWADFYWSSPTEGKAQCWIDGQGSNLSPIIVSVSNDQEAYVLQGVRTVFSQRGRLR